MGRLLVALVLLLFAAPLPPAAPPPSTPLGTLTTTALTLAAPPQSTLLLYEAHAQAPPRPSPAPPRRVPVPLAPTVIDPPLAAAIAAAPKTARQIVVFRANQADLGPAYALSDRTARLEWVYATLTAHAERDQAPLRQALAARAIPFEPLWIVNALLVSADGPAIAWLAAQPGIAHIAANDAHELIPQPSPTQALIPPAGPLPWGLERINAPQAWQRWQRAGEGIVVANIDTGVVATHPALQAAYRGWDGATAAHDYHWYDPTAEPFATPADPNGHGTHTMGTLVGGAAGPYAALGVAPGARWIAARGCESSTCYEADLIRAAQWMLAPTRRDGSEPRPDLAPHVINNSWGGTREDGVYSGFITAWEAAGIFAVFSAGNTGVVGCGTINNPANEPAAFGVGATMPDDRLAFFSSRGPTLDGRLKPELSAPGFDVISAATNGGVRSENGTSMAAPHVAGTVALLWSANPRLVGAIPATRALLTGSAEPRLADGCDETWGASPNNMFGFGILDAAAALDAGAVDIPWLSLPPTVQVPASGIVTVTITLDARQVPAPGAYAALILAKTPDGALQEHPIAFEVTPSGAVMVRGQTQDVWSGAGIASALDLGVGPAIRTDAAGRFAAALPPATYPLTATATGYAPAQLTLAAQAPLSTTIPLTPDAPHLVTTLDTSAVELAYGEQRTLPLTITNRGPQPLDVDFERPHWFWSVAQSPALLYDMSEFPPITLKDDQVITTPLELGFALPAYGSSITSLYLSSNGWASTRATTFPLPGASCQANSAFRGPAFAPFWADLDPERGGAIRAGNPNPDTFVISFEAVPAWRPPSIQTSPTYTFQLILRRDGRVEYRYGELQSLHMPWSVVAATGRESQVIRCQDRTTPLAGQRLILYNQPTTSVWLAAPPSIEQLAPGASVTVPLTVTGRGHLAWRAEPFQGRLRLRTNDPAATVRDLTLTAHVAAPRASIWLPTLR